MCRQSRTSPSTIGIYWPSARVGDERGDVSHTSISEFIASLLPPLKLVPSSARPIYPRRAPPTISFSARARECNFPSRTNERNEESSAAAVTECVSLREDGVRRGTARSRSVSPTRRSIQHPLRSFSPSPPLSSPPLVPFLPFIVPDTL